MDKPSQGFHGETPKLYHIALTKDQLFYVHHCISFAQGSLVGDVGVTIQAFQNVIACLDAMDGREYNSLIERFNALLTTAFPHLKAYQG